MLLKRLELQGFKSFAHKTVLEFPVGVVGIVGPNGSGKSNIIDAMKWLMGEREAKNLRGDKTDDLIFGGTDGKARVGLARASIIFDNTSGFFPVTFEEIVVTRKIFRDGTAEYLLNGASVRLRDIIDFFAAARLGARGLAIVNQGNSDIVVRATPAERRGMVEEILGLRQFQLKRHDAELKLQSTAVNLEKTRSMVEELLPRLRLLRKQATRFKERGIIEEELRALERAYFGAKLYTLEQQEVGVTPEAKRIDGLLGRAQLILRDVEHSVEKIQQQKPGRDPEFEKLRAREQSLRMRGTEIDRELGRIEVKLEMERVPKHTLRSTNELITMLASVQRGLSELVEGHGKEGFEKKVRQLISEIDAFLDGGNVQNAGAIQLLESAEATLIREQLVINEELAQIRGHSDGLEQQAQELNIRLHEAFKMAQQKKDELHALENQRNSLRFASERVAVQREDLKKEIEALGYTMNDFTARASSGVSDVGAPVERRMLRLRGELAAIGAVDASLIKEAEETENRYIFLETQTKDLEKASADLHTLIGDLSKKIKEDFARALVQLNQHFDKYFNLMFGGGHAKFVPVRSVAQDESGGWNNVREENEIAGLDIELRLPKKGERSLDVLSGGEKSLVSIAALFGLVAISPPPFLVLDEIDAALDEQNTRRFADLVKEFAKTTQFVVVTHNRATMEAAEVLYGVTMGADGASRLLSVKLEGQ